MIRKDQPLAAYPWARLAWVSVREGHDGRKEATEALTLAEVAFGKEPPAPRGRTNLPPPERAGEVVPVGRVFAEHVFTRPFAPPESRKVRDLEGSVPPNRWSSRPLSAAAVLPTGAKALGEPWISDPFVFGLAHTDSNQHVNSLVYLSLFEEAVVCRLAEVGRSPVVLARWIEIGYRKPCFAGDRVSMRFTLAEVDGGIGAFGVFVPTNDPLTDKPHAWIGMGLS